MESSHNPIPRRNVYHPLALIDRLATLANLYALFGLGALHKHTNAVYDPRSSQPFMYAFYIGDSTSGCPSGVVFLNHAKSRRQRRNVRDMRDDLSCPCEVRLAQGARQLPFVSLIFPPCEWLANSQSRMSFPAIPRITSPTTKSIHDQWL